MKDRKCLSLTIGVLTAMFVVNISPAAWAQKLKETAIQHTIKPITSLRCNTFTFDASGSHDPDNENINFFWDFGDGETSSKAVAEHTYKQSGDYDVALTITDNSGLECSTAVTTQRVRANIPPIASLVGPDRVCTEQPVVFDGSASTDDSTSKLGLEWSFGDGTSRTGVDKVTKVYKRGGQYNIKLTVDDLTGTHCSTSVQEKTIYVNEPPVANAGPEEILKCVNNGSEALITFDASNSSDINKDKLSFEWEFGDGEKAKGVTVKHKYRELGRYDAKLIVKDNSNSGCDTSVDFVTVRLNQAPQAEAGDDIIACTGESIEFDGSQSLVKTKGTATAKWIFGDGTTASGFNVAHTYDKPGIYQARLSVSNELNAMCPPSEDTRNVVINTTPSVAIKTVDTTCLGSEIHFDASSGADPDGDKLEYYWSFGDGTILRGGPKVSHKFGQGGDYRVSVIVDDGKGSICSTATANASVKVNTPPIADAGPNLACCLGQKTEFNASASTDPDGDQLTYQWNFGDGDIAMGAVSNHTYNKAGSFNVTLKVSDNSGSACSESTATFVANVNSSPVPVITIR